MPRMPPLLLKKRFFSRARIVAQDQDKDLAILQLDQIPDSAKELSLARSDPKAQDTLHILGNPAERPLWRWAAGTQPEVGQINARNRISNMRCATARWFSAAVRPSYGNSGGPVLNDDGEVVGIASFNGGPGGILTGAVHFAEIRDLLDSIVLHRVFSVENPTRFTLNYQVRWGENGEWKNHTLEPRTYIVHWLKGPFDQIPYIRFDASFEQGYQEKSYKLAYYTRQLGRGVNPSRDLDAMEYIFPVDKEEKNIDLLRRE